MSSSRGKKTAILASKKRKGASSSAAGRCNDWAAVEQVQMADAIRALLTTDSWELFFGIIEPTYLELTMKLYSTFHLQTVMTRYDDSDTVLFCLGGLIRQLSVQSLHRNRVISIGPYVTRLAQHFGLLNTATQESSLTPIGQMSPRGISSMLSMRMIERCRGTYPPQYRLAQSTDEEAYEDIPDDVPP
ncbi:hypothetical protein GOBAR_AA13617 [Gossypium barbadense]|uniref:Uncharacterized protein n=1 Tax=Gossypium barbadense TaxID=3634 RepID=A0A2P5XUL5_GOSBA|nr:hypothetical protein GOBAR_AA13617 [Gossypium barbadense]